MAYGYSGRAQRYIDRSTGHFIKASVGRLSSTARKEYKKFLKSKKKIPKLKFKKPPIIKPTETYTDERYPGAEIGDLFPEEIPDIYQSLDADTEFEKHRFYEIIDFFDEPFEEEEDYSSGDNRK